MDMIRIDGYAASSWELGTFNSEGVFKPNGAVAHLANQVESLREQLEFEKREHIEMQKYTLELERTLAECQKERAAATESWDGAAETCSRLHKKLAATEALLAKYRDALDEIAKPSSGMNFGDNYLGLVREYERRAQKALATPSPTAALNDCIANYLERLPTMIDGSVLPQSCALALRTKAKELRGNPNGLMR